MTSPSGHIRAVVGPIAAARSWSPIRLPESSNFNGAVRIQLPDKPDNVTPSFVNDPFGGFTSIFAAFYQIAGS